MTQVLVIDNYDSFVYNLVQYLGRAADDVTVRRNDAITVAGIRSLDPDAVVVSPGPGTPAEAGVSIPLFRETTYPTLGVCLGHQALCAANGGEVGHAPEIVHGKPSVVTHDGRGVFADLPDRIDVGRYHSLCVAHHDLPPTLRVTARTVADDASDRDDRPADGADRSGDSDLTPAASSGVVMGVRHREHPHVGVQFHPESVLTDAGTAMVENFLRVYAE
ncbi:MAG: aminodeoxychorismate/anthranilate synthase component II [Halobaculum sp.]